MKNNGVAPKYKLIKVDMVISEIYHIWGETPSSYTYGKTILAECRGYIRSDLKKALTIAQKARNAFNAESVLAVKYNQYKDRLPAADGTAKNLAADYERQVSVGEFKQAKETLDNLVARLIPTNKEQYSLKVQSSDENSTTVVLENRSGFMVSISGFAATSHGQRVNTNPKAPFTVYSNESRIVTIDAPLENLEVTARFTDSNGAKSLTLEKD